VVLGAEDEVDDSSNLVQDVLDISVLVDFNSNNWINVELFCT
jgi:hypothetical protein